MASSQCEPRRGSHGGSKVHTQKSEEAEAVLTPPAAEPEPLTGSPFFTVLVTPKLTFSLPRQKGWRIAQDIPQEALQEAFLSRFPVRFPASGLAFKPATPMASLSGVDRLVYRVTAADGGDDERVLLAILSKLDRAYSAKYEQQLEEARADLLSSSMTFQVVADEVRAGQEACAKKWGAEVAALKDQMSTNQKRLFLLEREKEGLQRNVTSSEESCAGLRHQVQGLSEENASLRQRQAELEAQLSTLRDAVAAHMTATAGGVDVATHREAAAVGVHVGAQEVACQTASPEGEAIRSEAMERWQQQLSAMSDWLRHGAALLDSAPPAGRERASLAGSSGGSSPAAGASPTTQPLAQSAPSLPPLVATEGEEGGEPSSIC